jgi:transcriptional accessory protein Tex/SPT6
MDQAEKTLLIASVGYSRSNNINLSKISWALSSVMQKPENSIFNKLKKIDQELDEQLKDIYGIRKMAKKLSMDEEIIDDNLENRIGDIVNVEVLSVKTFGAVCRIEGTTRTLLLHLSEVADEFITDLRTKLKEGDIIQAMLITNPKEELGLSTRRINALQESNE